MDSRENGIKNGMVGFNRFSSIFIIGLVLFLVFFVSKAVLSHFIFAVLSAYILNSPVTWVESKGIPRALASFITVFFLFTSVGFVFLYVMPILIRQFFSVLDTLSGFFPAEEHHFIEKFKKYYANIDTHNWKGMFEILGEEKTQLLTSNLTKILQMSIHYGRSFTEIVISAAIFPLLTFYTLWDWPTLAIEIKGLIPRSIVSDTSRLGRSIRSSVIQCIKGQFLASLLILTYYSLMLNFASINNAFILAFFAGCMSFIPYIGAILSCSVGVLSAVVQFGDLTQILTVAGIFFFGILLEGQLVIPLLVGKKVEINPIWVMAGVMISATLFGIPGAMLSLPITSAASSIIKFFIKKYKESYIYRHF